MQSLDRQTRSQLEVVTELAEIRGEETARSEARCQGRVRVHKGGALGRTQIGHEERLVELRPFAARLGQGGQYLLVHGQEPRQQVEG